VKTIEEIVAEVNTALRNSDSESLERLAEMLDALSTPRAHASAAQTRAVTARLTGDSAKALDNYTSALAQFEILNNAIAQAHTFGGMANVYLDIGDYPKALEHYRRALTIHEDHNDLAGAAVVLGNIGGVHYSTGNYAEALELSFRALTIHTSNNDPERIAEVTGNIGNVYLAIGDYSQATTYCSQALDLHNELGKRAFVALVSNTLAMVYAQQEQWTNALHYHEQARSLYDDLGNRASVSRVLGSLISVHLQCGNVDNARSLLEVQTNLPYVNPTVECTHLDNRARLAVIDDHPDVARDILHQALAVAVNAGLRPSCAAMHQRLRDLAKHRGDFDAYVEHNDAYMRIHEDIRGQESSRRFAMVEAERRFEAERLEKARQQDLIHSMLPRSVADRILRGESVHDSIECCSVLFMDLVGFTAMSASTSNDDLVTLLDGIFSTADACIRRHAMIKIKTIGDAYMCAGFDDDVVASAADAALSLLAAMSERFPSISVRIGIHAGPVTAGVIGSERLQYDVWGDTVNIASRMESTGQPGCIHVSKTFADMLPAATYSVVHRGMVDVKGKGSMATAWLASAIQDDVPGGS